MIPAQAYAYIRELNVLTLIAVLALVSYHIGIQRFDGDTVGVNACILLSGFFILRMRWIKLKGVPLTFLPFVGAAPIGLVADGYVRK